MMILTLAMLAFNPRRWSTANAGPTVAGVASDVAGIQEQLEQMRADYDAKLEALTSENATLKSRVADSTGTQPTAADPLGLGGLQLPKGVEVKDVLWRKQAGLSLKHAVQAALNQFRFSNKKAAKLAAAKTAAATAAPKTPPEV